MFTFLKKLALLSPLYKYTISGNSMSPSIAAGESVVVNRWAYTFKNPKEEDIVALHDPRDGKVLIKRITKKRRKEFFVEGDNKKQSTDSRVFGWIEKKAIIGKVFLLQ